MLYRIFAATVNSVADLFSPKKPMVIPAADLPAPVAAAPKPKSKANGAVPVTAIGDSVAKPGDQLTDVSVPTDGSGKLVEPAYLKKARSYLGIKEVPGAAANAQIVGFFARAGFPGIKDDETAWCAAFVGSCLEETGFHGSKALNARSYLTWGTAVKKPYPGAVAVLWRGSPASWEGHVAFYLDEDATHVRLLGGNQGNKVSVARFPKGQLLGYRNPPTMSGSRTAAAATVGMMAAGAGSSTLLESQQQILGISGALKEIGVSMPTFMLAAQILGIGCFLIIMWARYQDMKTKGR